MGDILYELEEHGTFITQWSREHADVSTEVSTKNIETVAPGLSLYDLQPSHIEQRQARKAY